MKFLSVNIGLPREVLASGRTIIRIATDPQQMTAREVFDVACGEGADRAVIERAMEMPALAANWREMFAERMAGK